MDDKRIFSARELKRDFVYSQITLNFRKLLHSVTLELWTEK